ncbi:MAG: HEAT repeat domain-containing protein [Candidatus Riflebacteria bacterium]|nr:HEAT repeat domain-containing protein [Candidatus Riflebacteria bacterium]
MMNAILMVIAALIVILLVFVIFSQDDFDDSDERLSGESFTGSGSNTASLKEFAGNSPTILSPSTLGSSADASPGTAARTFTGVVSGNSQVSADASSLPPLKPFVMPTAEPSVKVGSEEDLRFRRLLDDQLAPISDLKTTSAVAAVVQLRFPEDVLASQTGFIPLFQAAESLLSPEAVDFPFSVYLGNQMDRLWLFGFDEERDDAVFEALVCAKDVISRFKKGLENNASLAQARARISIGMAFGDVTRTMRGPLGAVNHVGKAVYLAEILAEAAGDFMIYVDSDIHRLSLPLFDYREWRPTKLRDSLPPIAFFEVMGWNKKEEIFAFAAHQEAYARRSVAVAYRYLDFEELGPLLQLLADGDEKVVMEALATVAVIGDERAIGILKKILPEAQKPSIRAAIIEAMGRIGKEDIMPVLLASSKDVNWQVRFQAARGLYRVAGNEAIRHLEELRNDEDGAVRAAIFRIFYAHSLAEKDLIALGELLTDLSVRARKAAMEALVDIGTPLSLRILARSFRDQEPDGRRHLLRLLMSSTESSLYQCFLNIFYEADERQRADIVLAMRRAKLVK